MRSHGRCNLDLGSVGNMDVAESGQSREPLRSQAVEIVNSGLAQGKAATRVGPTRQTVNKWWIQFFEGRNHGRQNMFQTSFLRQLCRENRVLQYI